MGVYTVNQTDGSLQRVAGGTLYADAPIGAIQSYGGVIAPAGWLICDGSAVSRTDYEDLFNVIGTAFGTGDGSTTFNLPDLREAVPKGAGLTGHTVGAHLDADGLAVGEFLDDRFQDHKHSILYRQASLSGSGIAVNISSSGSSPTSTGDTETSYRTGATTEVKSVGVNYIIKAKQVGMPTDFASAVGDIAVDKNTYSTSETIVGKWIDGKPIYRKVVNFGALPNATVKSVDHNITNLEQIVSVHGITTDASQFLVIPHSYPIATNNISIAITSTVVRITTETNRTSYTDTKIILEYTKTTP